MITSKSEYKQYLYADMAFYYALSKKERIVLWFIQDPAYCIAKYLRLLRKEEYYHNVRSDPFGKIALHCVLRKKNHLGNRLGFKIPANCFESGLTIYHHGAVIVNENARIGHNCQLHGENCIGNNGKTQEAPIIGDNADIGVGAKVIGNVTLADGVKIGANAVVTKAFEQSDITLVGMPAKALLKQ